jgi:hypothetical protein
MVEEETGPLCILFGRAYQTSDGLVEGREARWKALEAPEKAAGEWRPINRANGPASHGRRTQWLHRRVPCADHIATPIQRRYDPPSPSQSHPMERCWGLVALPGHGTKRSDVETMREWAQRRTWKGRPPVVALSRQGDHKGIALGKRARRAVEKRWERHPQVPKGDILIRPASAW